MQRLLKLGSGVGTQVLILPILLSTLAGPAGAVELVLEQVVVAGGIVEFFSGPCDAARPVPAQLQPVGQAGGWDLLVDRRAETASYLGENFYYFLYLKNGGTRPEHCFRVTAVPKGSFLDHRSRVWLSIVEDDQQIHGSMELVLHNGHIAPPYLSAEPLEKRATVGLAGDLVASLKLKNLLHDAELTIERVEVAADRPKEWRNLIAEVKLPPGSPTGFRLPPAGNIDRAVQISATASKRMALGEAITPLPASIAHENLTARITYVTPGGIQRFLDVEFPIRFMPSILHLVVAMLLGALLGSAVLGSAVLVWRQARRSHSARSRWPWIRAFLSAVGLAVILEALGLVLVHGGSRFQLFGLALDPNQLLPAFLIGAFSGLFNLRTLETAMKTKAGRNVVQRLLADEDEKEEPSIERQEEQKETGDGPEAPSTERPGRELDEETEQALDQAEQQAPVQEQEEAPDEEDDGEVRN